MAGTGNLGVCLRKGSSDAQPRLPASITRVLPTFLVAVFDPAARRLCSGRSSLFGFALPESASPETDMVPCFR